MNDLVARESVTQADLIILRLDSANKLLAEANTLQQTKSVIDIAVAAEVYAERQKLGEQAIGYAHEIKTYALHKLGEMLRNVPKNAGARGVGKSGVPQKYPTLNEIGIDKKLSSLAQQIAALPMEQVQAVAARVKTIEEVRKEQRKETTKAKESAAFAASSKRDWIVTKSQTVIRCQAIITDPPYGILDQHWEPQQLEQFTKEWLTRWNESDADFLFSFWSQDHLFAGREWFDLSLTNYSFQQLLVWHYPNNKSPQSRRGFKQTWEPIFFYRRNDSDKQIKIVASSWGDELTDFDCFVAAVPQSNFNDENFKQHPAQKPVQVMRWLINAATQPGEIICDPFCGSGTTGIAALQLGRHFHGIESDDNYRLLADKRIATYGV